MMYADDPQIRQNRPALTQAVDVAIKRAGEYLLSRRQPEGFWIFDLEADVTIPSEYILLQRFLGRKNPPARRDRMMAYIRRRQLPVGGWSLFEGGPPDLSATVKAYFALKVAGDEPSTPHMARARRWIQDQGGAERVNVFTRITLALFGQIPWRTAPAMPVEIMLLPEWFFFHITKVSYWSRTVIVPLLILYAKRPVCRLNPQEDIPELFRERPDRLGHLDRFVRGNRLKDAFILLDRILKRVEPRLPGRTRRHAIRRAESWTRERMQEEGGIGGIFPAMANAVMALKALGYSDSHPDVVRGIKAVDGLLTSQGDETFCQPCLSPIWDTCLSLLALLEADMAQDHPAIKAAVDWLFSRQILAAGDWNHRAPKLKPGGWAFEFGNAYYPDLDDTPVTLMAILRAGAGNYQPYAGRIRRAVDWVLGMQSRDGGWGAFDIDNNALYLNHIPFADHGALLDPSTADLTARCAELLSVLGYGAEYPPTVRALDFIRRNQDESGAWWGRWGVNYLYGTWSVLAGLRQIGEDMHQPYIQKAVQWLKSRQNGDGGWGENCLSYDDPSHAGRGESTASQTAWALMGLMAAGETESGAVERGIAYLCGTQNPEGSWGESGYTGTGFPKVFYLRYHGYRHYFPLWALGAYRRLCERGATLQDETRLDRPEDLFPNPVQ